MIDQAPHKNPQGRAFSSYRFHMTPENFVETVEDYSLETTINAKAKWPGQKFQAVICK